MKRVVTQQDTLEAAIKRGELSCEYDKENTTRRKRRNAQPLELCDTSSDERYYRLLSCFYAVLKICVRLHFSQVETVIIFELFQGLTRSQGLTLFQSWKALEN